MIVDYRLAGIRRVWTVPPPSIYMHIPPEFIRSVVFIGHEFAGQWVADGTGFVVGLPLPNIPEKAVAYIVTARHVMKDVRKHEYCAIRANLSGGGYDIMRIPHSDEWHEHPSDPHVDAIVTPFPPPFEKWDISPLGESFFLTDDQIHSLGIGPGDDVAMIGLFHRTKGNAQNTPIVRVGNIAMMPRDRVETSADENAEVYLVEVRSIGGMSGSPCFAWSTLRTNIHKGGKGDEEFVTGILDSCYFMGLAQGHWWLNSGYMAVPEDERAINEGIALVVPAKKILEILNCEDLVMKRKEIEKSIRKFRDPSSDSVQQGNDKGGDEEIIADGEEGMKRFSEAMKHIVNVPKKKTRKKK